MTFRVPEKFRITTGRLASSADVGNNGAFDITLSLPARPRVLVIATDGAGWEHVSVSRTDRTPSWEEMCAVKALFWEDEDEVMQLHPPRSQWVNNHSRCLHLWRPIDQSIPLPPSWMVGFKELGTLA